MPTGAITWKVFGVLQLSRGRKWWILKAKHLSCITLVLVFKLLKQSFVKRKSLIFPLPCFENSG